jgi:hypothetical protein
MSILYVEAAMIVVLSVCLINTMKNIKVEYSKGARYQIIVNYFATTRTFASEEEARAFAHAIAKAKDEEGEQVRLLKVFVLDEHKDVAPIGLKAAFESGKIEYQKGYNKAVMPKKWW